jgi:hypothetical protein
MASLGSKAEPRSQASLVDALEVVHGVQHGLLISDAQLQRVEEASKYFTDMQKYMDDKIDGMIKMMQQWNSASEMSSSDRPPRPYQLSPTPPPPLTSLTPEELAFLKRQEAAGKISLMHETSPSTSQTTTETTPSNSLTFHIPNTHYQPTHRFVYTHTPPD